MTIQGQVARLGLALAAVGAITAACTAALDFDKLNRGDGGAADANGDFDGVTPPDGPRPDKAPCLPDGPCQVIGQQGLCAAGKTVCEGSVGTCQQVVQPAAEACDGQDSDCDGAGDADDAEAHAACGGGTKYCAGAECKEGCRGDGDCDHGNTCNLETSRCVCGSRSGCSGEFNCVDGRCLCGTNKLACASGEGCQGDACVCGAKTNASGRVCDQPNPRCLNNTSCGCDADSTCNAQETCTNGNCTCGTGSKPTGPFCEQGECDPATNSCVGIPPDAGPDLPPPDLGADGPDPDGPDPDGPRVDGPKVDGPKSDAPKTDAAKDATPADQNPGN